MATTCGSYLGSGGKGNYGKFIDRNRRVCAAGLETAQRCEDVPKSLRHYLLQDEVDALIHDSIIPLPTIKTPPSKHPPRRDFRNTGPNTEGRALLNPPIETKFQTLVSEIKETSYRSYWDKPLGKQSDLIPALAKSVKNNTTFGKVLEHDNLCDVVFPAIPLPDPTRKSRFPGIQTNRNYCLPAFDPDKIYGHKTYQDIRGRLAKCCLTEDRLSLGNGVKTTMSSIQANYIDDFYPKLEMATTPNNNIDNVPKGYTFGKANRMTDNIRKVLIPCQINSEKEILLKCIGHLNTVRKCMSKQFDTTFFKKFYLDLKFLDVCKTEWLPKQVVYQECHRRFIRIEPELIEPLLSLWKVYDGSQIEYKTFCHILNFKERYPELPKMCDVPEQCLNFETTYGEMTKPGQEADEGKAAGLPSGRYFDMDYPVTPENCCRAHRTYLPQETDMEVCLRPSVFAKLGVTHRDMYAVREPHIVRRVFESYGRKFSDDEEFEKVWNEAKKYHSKGLVCYKTFRQALDKYLAEIQCDLKK